MTCGSQYNPNAPGHRNHATVVWNQNSRFFQSGRNKAGSIHAHKDEEEKEEEEDDA